MDDPKAVLTEDKERFRLKNGKLFIPEIDTTITEKQFDAWHFLSLGLNNKEIAAEMGVTFQTVKNHVTVLFIKLKTENRVECAVLGLCFGAISREEVVGRTVRLIREEINDFGRV